MDYSISGSHLLFCVYLLSWAMRLTACNDSRLHHWFVWAFLLCGILLANWPINLFLKPVPVTAETSRLITGSSSKKRFMKVYRPQLAMHVTAILELKLHLFDLLWICCGFVVQLFDLLLWTSRVPYSIDSICCGFVIESIITNLQHLDMSRCCGFVEKLWICCGSLWIYCGFVVDLLYNKSATNRTSGVWA
jgi:hypothetical protein